MSKTQRKKIIAIVRTMLTHRRCGGLKQEQRAYDTLVLYCNQNNFDFASCLDGATRWLKENSIAANMNGLV